MHKNDQNTRSGSVNIEKNSRNYLDNSFIRFIFGNIK